MNLTYKLISQLQAKVFYGSAYARPFIVPVSNQTAKTMRHFKSKGPQMGKDPPLRPRLECQV